MFRTQTRFSWILSAFVLFNLPATTHADGERDNDPNNVRRVPREGIEVPVDREATLREQLKELQSELSLLKKNRDPSFAIFFRTS